MCRGQPRGRNVGLHLWDSLPNSCCPAITTPIPAHTTPVHTTRALSFLSHEKQKVIPKPWMARRRPSYDGWFGSDKSPMQMKGNVPIYGMHGRLEQPRSGRQQDLGEYWSQGPTCPNTCCVLSAHCRETNVDSSQGLYPRTSTNGKGLKLLNSKSLERRNVWLSFVGRC